VRCPALAIVTAEGALPQVVGASIDVGEQMGCTTGGRVRATPSCGPTDQLPGESAVAAD